MAKSKAELKPDFFCSADAKDVYFAKLYPGLMQHPKFLSLPLGARYLYLCCRANSRTKEARQTLHAHSETHEREYSENTFVFTARQLDRFGISRSHAAQWFRALIDAGFIDLLEANGLRRMPNIYAFSGRWRGS